MGFWEHLLLCIKGLNMHLIATSGKITPKNTLVIANKNYFYHGSSNPNKFIAAGTVRSIISNSVVIERIMGTSLFFLFRDSKNGIESDLPVSVSSIFEITNAVKARVRQIFSL